MTAPLRSTWLKLLKCPVVYQKMENGISRHSGGIVQLMMQWKKKWDCGRSAKMVVPRKKVAKQRVFAPKKKARKEKMKNIETDIYVSSAV